VAVNGNHLRARCPRAESRMPLRPRSPQSKGRDSRRDTCYPAAPAHSDSRRGTLRTGQQRQSVIINRIAESVQANSGNQRRSDARRCAQRRLETTASTPSHLNCTNGEGNQLACKWGGQSACMQAHLRRGRAARATSQRHSRRHRLSVAGGRCAMSTA
jgi:hypothetical protein